MSTFRNSGLLRLLRSGKRTSQRHGLVPRDSLVGDVDTDDAGLRLLAGDGEGHTLTILWAQRRSASFNLDSAIGRLPSDTVHDKTFY